MARKQNMGSSAHFGSNVFRVALILLCLVLVSVHLMSGLFAKYSITGHSTDGASVAKFDVEVTGADPNAVVITCSEVATGTGEYQITVKNNSEVAVSYALTVDVPASSGVTAAVETGKESGTLAPGGSVDVDLTFTVDWTTVTAAVKGDSVDLNVSFTVNAHVEQID